MRRALLVYNPTAGRRRQAALLAAVDTALRQGGWAAEAAPTAAPADATRLAAAARAAGAEAVFVLGGDGTVREAAAGLLGSRVALGILPAGTTNVLARALGLPADPVAAARVAAAARPRPLDVGRCGGEPFLMMASAGFDAFVLARLDPAWKARFGRLGILAQGLRDLPGYRYPELTVEADGEALPASFVAVCNIPLYGGAFALAPAACCDDRRLDLVTFAGRGNLSTLAFASALARGAHLARPDVAVRPVTRVTLRGPAGTPVQIDGDPCAAEVPVTIELAPEPLAVLAPPRA
jgi:YegS/Rv2252/BmrU family lipid kinase